MKRNMLVSIIVLALVAIGVVIYLARPHADETDDTQLRQTPPAPTQPALQPASPPPALASCVGPIDSQTPIATLIARHQWAHSLLLKNHPDAALTELRGIATLDPGYPAINLEISDALLKSKQIDESKDAIKLQLEISQCLSNLPPRDAQEYCKSEWVTAPQGGCVAELAAINQKANYQAGLVDAELRLNPGPNTTPAATSANAAPRPARAAPQPTISPGAGTAPPTIPPGASTPAPGQGNTSVASADKPVVAPKPLPPPTIKSAEASDHVGQLATVCGTIVSKHTAAESNGKPTFINLDRLFPNQTFTIVVWDTERSAVGEFPETGNVCATGTIGMYRGNPQIVVHDAKSWSQSIP